MFCCPRCSHLSTILNNVVEPESGVTILFNIVDSYEQCGQQNIVQSCFHQYCINLSVFTRVAIARSSSLCNAHAQLENRFKSLGYVSGMRNNSYMRSKCFIQRCKTVIFEILYQLVLFCAISERGLPYTLKSPNKQLMHTFLHFVVSLHTDLCL